MRIIYHVNSAGNRWRIDFYPDERIENVSFVSRQLRETAPEHPNFTNIRRRIEKYCNDYNLNTCWCI